MNGSVVNGIKSITVNFIGNVNLYTAYIVKSDGTPNFQLAKENQAKSFTYNVNENQYPPRYFKIEANDLTQIASIEVSCSASESIAHNVTIPEGSYAGTLGIDFYPTEDYGYEMTFEGKGIEVTDSYITFYKPIDNKGNFESINLYYAGKYQDTGKELLVSSQDELNPDIYTLSLNSKNYTIYAEDLKIDKSSSKIDGNYYLINMNNIAERQVCTSLDIFHNNKIWDVNKHIPAPTMAKPFDLVAKTNEGVTSPVIWTTNDEKAISLIPGASDKEISFVANATSGTYTLTATCENISTTMYLDVKWAMPSNLKGTTYQYVDKTNGNLLVVSIDAKNNATAWIESNGAKLAETSLPNKRGVIDARNLPGLINFSNDGSEGIQKLTLEYNYGVLSVKELVETTNSFENIIDATNEEYVPTIVEKIEFPSYLNGKTFDCFISPDMDSDYDDIYVSITFADNAPTFDVIDYYNGIYLYEIQVDLDSLTDTGSEITFRADFPSSESAVWEDYMEFSFSKSDNTLTLMRYGSLFPTSPQPATGN